MNFFQFYVHKITYDTFMKRHIRPSHMKGLWGQYLRHATPLRHPWGQQYSHSLFHAEM